MKWQGKGVSEGLAMAQIHLLFHIPLKILKPYLLILRYRIMNRIYRIINTFIHRLDPARHIHLSLQLHRIVLAD